VSGKLLIAGVGNIFLGDDGFGVEVANRLATSALPDFVRVADYGIRGMHLAYDLASSYDGAILVDATARGGAPGTIYLIEPELSADGAEAGDLSPLFNAHGMQPDVVLSMLSLLDSRDLQVLVVGCEPANVDYGIGLSEPVAAAVDEAVAVIADLVARAASAGGYLPAMKEQAYVPRHPG